MALLGSLGSPMASNFCTNGLCCSRNRWVLFLRFQIFLSPSISVMKIMQIVSMFHNFTDGLVIAGQFAAEIDWSLVYILLTLATTLICTLLIVYRIFRHAPGIIASRKIIEMLIESSAMYSISLIIYLVLVSRNLESAFYADIIATYVKVRLAHIFV